MLEYLRITFIARLAGQGIGERGASAVEYGLLITGIASLIAVSVFAFGGSVGGLFGGTCQQISSAGAGNTC